MSQEASVPFLLAMKSLIRNGMRHFVRRTKDGENYLQMLADLGLTSVEEAWEYVHELEPIHYFSGPEIDHRDGIGSPKVVWVFKMEINGTITYIKLKDESTVRGCVCMSFHKDQP